MIIDDATSENDALIAGYQAARAGHSFRDCPHPYGTNIRRAWLDGHQEGLRSIRPTRDFRTSVREVRS